jgi:hypothetical protein
MPGAVVTVAEYCRAAMPADPRTAPSLDMVRVGIPIYAGPAIHICRYPVPAPRQVFASFNVPFPKLAAYEPLAFAIEALLLRDGFANRQYQVLPRDVDAGVVPLWQDDPESPLLVPSAFVEERLWKREWAARTVCTPSEVGVTVPPYAISQVAWSVLVRADATAVSLILAHLGRVSDRFRCDPDVLEQLVRSMHPPPAVRGRLLAEARGGRPLFNPRGVTWVLRELAAADAPARDPFLTWVPTGNDPASHLGRAWFRCLAGQERPALDEVLLAAWMLQEVFHGTNAQIDHGHDHVLSMVTTLGYRFGSGSDWLQTLHRWLAIWTMDDDHPAVVNVAPLPSELRRLYASRRGVPVDRFLAGTWAICVRLWFAMDPSGHVMAGEPSDFFSFPLDTGPVVFSDEFITAFRNACVMTLDAFAAEARKEPAGPAYGGLGTLTQTDSLACRNAPVIEFPDGRLVVISVDLLAQRVVATHDLRLGRSAASSALGKMFEAYVSQQIDRLSDRSIVLDESEITSLVGINSQRCDALVVHENVYLAIEIATQRLSRDVAAGEVSSINEMATRYQHEADQAVATLAALDDIIPARHLPRVHGKAHLVVTDTPIPHSPAFLARLSALHSGRSPKFICSVDELELLVALGVRGWSVPSAVLGWQQSPERVPLEAKLIEMVRTLPPEATVPMDVPMRWVAMLPDRSRPAA